MVFFIIFGGLTGLGLLAWILINTFTVELHEPKNEEHRPREAFAGVSPGTRKNR